MPCRPRSVANVANTGRPGWPCHWTNRSAFGPRPSRSRPGRHPRHQALRQQFLQLDGSTRRGWLLGPALGADYAALQPLLAQVPVLERESLLQVLRTMSPLQRRELAVLAQRTPPQQRPQLRRDLLSTAQVNRSAWLRQRLDQ